MRERLALYVILCIALLTTSVWLNAQSANLQSYSTEAKALSQKRVEKKTWTGGSNAGLTNKTFPIEQWDKHFSPLGGKRANIEAEDSWGTQVIEKKIREMPLKDYEMSSWNDRMAKLKEQAGIRTDETARMVSQNRLYQTMLQDSQRFPEMADTLSLRDINRYQFRRNRSDGEVPVEKAGGR